MLVTSRLKWGICVLALTSVAMALATRPGHISTAPQISAAQEASFLETATEVGKIKYKIMKRWTRGLARMSARVFIWQLDVKRRNSQQVFLEEEERTVGVADTVGVEGADTVGVEGATASLLQLSAKTGDADMCDPDIDPIIILLDWAEYYVEVVYEVMEKYIRKMRESEAKQAGSGAIGMETSASPAEALIELRKFIDANGGLSVNHTEDKNPEQLSPSRGPLDHLFDNQQLADDNHFAVANLNHLAETLKAGISKTPNPLLPPASFLEVETATGGKRGKCKRYLWYFNILMRWGCIIVEKKDDKFGAALLQLEEGVGAPDPPSTDEMETPTRADLSEALGDVCPNDDCTRGDPEQILGDSKKFVQALEKEAFDEGASGFGPVPHVPRGSGTRPSAAAAGVDPSGWSVDMTRQMRLALKERDTPHGTRPAAVGLTEGKNCAVFYRKAMWKMAVLGWMTWWAMYYTLLYWLKVCQDPE